MARACAFDVDENVAPAPPTLRVRRREVAATLPPGSADWGRGGSRRGGGAARSPLDSPGITQEVGSKVLVRALSRPNGAASKPVAITLPGPGRHVAGRDVATLQHAPLD